MGIIHAVVPGTAWLQYGMGRGRNAVVAGRTGKTSCRSLMVNFSVCVGPDKPDLRPNPNPNRNVHPDQHLLGGLEVSRGSRAAPQRAIMAFFFKKRATERSTSIKQTNDRQEVVFNLRVGPSCVYLSRVEIWGSVKTKVVVRRGNGWLVPGTWTVLLTMPMIFVQSIHDDEGRVFLSHNQ